MPLLVSPCRRLCDWAAIQPGLFACGGCGSQWERGQGWTPRQADGSEPAGLAEELSRPVGAAGSAGS